MVACIGQNTQQWTLLSVLLYRLLVIETSINTPIDHYLTHYKQSRVVSLVLVNCSSGLLKLTAPVLAKTPVTQCSSFYLICQFGHTPTTDCCLADFNCYKVGAINVRARGPLPSMSRC